MNGRRIMPCRHVHNTFQSNFLRFSAGVNYVCRVIYAEIGGDSGLFEMHAFYTRARDMKLNGICMELESIYEGIKLNFSTFRICFIVSITVCCIFLTKI